MHRRVLVAACALAATAALAACGDADESSTAAQSTASSTPAQTSTEPLKVAYFGPAGEVAYYAAEAKAGEAWAKANGADYTVIDAGFDAQKQVNQIEDATASKKYNAYVVFAGFPLVAPALQDAAESGIRVVLVDSTVTSDFTSTQPGVPWLTARVAHPFSARGAALAEQVIAACEGIDPCEVSYLFSVQAGDPQEKAIIDAFAKGLEGHPNIKRLADRGPTFAQRGPAANVTRDLLQAEPGIDVIASLAQGVAGAELALKRAGKPYGTGDGEVRLVGIGATKHAIDGVLAGRWLSTQTYVPKDEMVMALDLVKQAHEGELTQPKGIDPITAGKYPEILDKQAIQNTGFEAQYDG